MKKNKLWLILIPIILIILIGAGIGVKYAMGSGERAYFAQISEARSYSAKGDFDNAVKSYEKAISMDETRPEAFEGLIKLYLLYNMPDEARQVLLRYETLNPGDSSLRNQYDNQITTMENQREIDSTISGGSDVEKQVNEELGLNTQLLRFFTGATYANYTENYGAGTITSEGSGARVTYPLFYCVYAQDSLYSNGKPREEARPVSVSMLDLSMLFTGLNGGVSVTTLESACGVRMTSSDEMVTFEYEGCTVKFTAENGVLAGKDAYNIITIPVGSMSVSECALSGGVTDATTGKPVSGFTITFRAGENNRSGEYAAINQNCSSSYSVNLAPGIYTAEIACEGFITEYFEVEIFSWFNTDEMNFVISPVLAPDEIRIVLEWNAEPRDLDSHLFGTSSSGRWEHIYYASSFSMGVASLDVDDRSGYGPETTTITDAGGSYTFAVVDYHTTGKMAAMGATVKIYQASSDSPIVLTVPADVEDIWEVCKIENGEVIVTNRPYTGNEL